MSTPHSSEYLSKRTAKIYHPRTGAKNIIPEQDPGISHGKCRCAKFDAYTEATRQVQLFSK